MGVNFHTAFVAGTTAFRATDINGPIADLDKAITYLKNVMIGCDGIITYDNSTGVLTWSGTIHIYFVSSAGLTIHNSIAAGNVTLSDTNHAYVNLNETNNTVLTVSTGAITAGSASNFITYNRLVLGFRNTSDNELYGLLLPLVIRDSHVKNTLFDANTILGATADNIPYAITISEQQVVGRLTGGVIKGLSVTELTTLVNAATVATAGKIELATNAETLTGTDTGRAVTPDDLKYAMNNGMSFGATDPGKFYPRKIIQATEPNAGTAATQVDAGEFVIWATSSTAAAASFCYNLGGTVLTVGIS